jgi:uncharacterized membrane protein (UPF0127 family)
MMSRDHIEDVLVRAVKFAFMALLVVSVGIGLAVWHAFANIPKSAVVRIGSTDIPVEVAATQRMQSLGLSRREKLPATSGMVFVFCPPKVQRFWMMNTSIPLDMLFVRDNQIKKVCADAQPFSGTPDKAPRFGDVLVSEVIEVNAGFAKQHDIKEGTRVSSDLGYEPYLVNLFDRLGSKFQSKMALK